MRSYHSDISLFSPIDASTSEGAEILAGHIANAMQIRLEQGEKEGRVTIPYDTNGLFGKVITNKYVVLVLVPEQEDANKKRHLWFTRAFAAMYLKRENEPGAIGYKELRAYDRETPYNAIICIQKANASMPENISFQDTVFAIDDKERPVFVFDADDLDLMETLPEKDREEMALRRMTYAWSRYLDWRKEEKF